MKTVAVLAALAAVATAVPALPGYGNERYMPVHRLPAYYRRQKKSPQELEFNPAFNAAPAFEPVPEVSVTAPADVLRTELEAAPETSARTFGIKKPIIVKKKFGYHLYRDSDEEQAQADPQEKCTKEVKVKLCDAEHLARSSDKMRSADEDSNAPITEKEMKHSIKMAKEAVENLQKMSQFKNAELGPDAELHSDIEVARQALEHIQQNFGNLESMNLQATTLSDAEALQNARFKIAHTDSERMAQWKEAIENIQKNAELARNIEDSFKSVSETKVSTEESTKKMKSSELVATSEDHQELTSMNIQAKTAEHGTPLKKEAEQENVHEMLPSASEHLELKSEDMPRKASEDMPRKSNEASPKMEDDKAENIEKSANVEHIQTEKIAEQESTLLVSASPTIEKSAQESAIKSNEFEDKRNMEKTVQPKTSEKIEDALDLAPAQSAPVMNAVLPPASDSHRAANQWAHTQEKNAWEETHINTLAKSNENVPVNNDQKTDLKLHMNQEKSAIIDTTSLMKTAEQNNKQQNVETKIDQNNVQGKNAQELIKSAVDVEHAPLSPMRSASVMSTANINQELPAQAKNWHEDKMTPKSGEIFHGDAEFERNAPHPHHGPHGLSTFAQSGAHSHVGMHGKMEHMPFHGGHEMHGQHFHGHHMHGMGFHGKTADTDSMVQATSQVNFNDASGKAAAERNMQWKQKEAARGAYGPGPYGAAGALNLAGAAGGPGAVGVFPGANVGGCAIPLLLSCSPSVVPGSLAKTSYGAHAYRAGEDGHFHHKRDTKKTNEIKTAKVKRTPTKVIQKIPVEKKL